MVMLWINDHYLLALGGTFLLFYSFHETNQTGRMTISMCIYSDRTCALPRCYKNTISERAWLTLKVYIYIYILFVCLFLENKHALFMSQPFMCNHSLPFLLMLDLLDFFLICTCSFIWYRLRTWNCFVCSWRRAVKEELWLWMTHLESTCKLLPP